MPQPNRTRSHGHLTLVTDGYTPADTHQPWCDLTEHTDAACRSTPIALKFGYRGEQPGAVSAASMQLTTAAGPDGTATRAEVTVGAAVFALEIEQIAALGAGLESLLMSIAGLPEQGAFLARKAAALAAPAPRPALAEV